MQYPIFLVLFSYHVFVCGCTRSVQTCRFRLEVVRIPCSADEDTERIVGQRNARSRKAAKSQFPDAQGVIEQVPYLYSDLLNRSLQMMGIEMLRIIKRGGDLLDRSFTRRAGLFLSRNIDRFATLAFIQRGLYRLGRFCSRGTCSRVCRPSNRSYPVEYRFHTHPPSDSTSRVSIQSTSKKSVAHDSQSESDTSRCVLSLPCNRKAYSVADRS